MEEWHRRTIVSNKYDLIYSIEPHAGMRAVLEQSEVLSKIELDRLEREDFQIGPIVGASRLLDLLVKRYKGSDGQYAFDVLINALKKSNQGRPAEILEQGKQEYLSGIGQRPNQQVLQQGSFVSGNLASSEPQNATGATSSEPQNATGATSSEPTCSSPPQQQIAGFYLSSVGKLPNQQGIRPEGCVSSKVAFAEPQNATVATSSEPPSQSTSLSPPQQQIAKTSSSLKDDYKQVLTQLNVKIDKPSTFTPSLPEGAYNINPDNNL